MIDIMVDNISSDFYPGNFGMLYLCLDKLDGIAGELRQLKGDLEKQEKINKIAKNSINTWIKSVMKDQVYPYYITENENKIILSIKMKDRKQMDIPIYYSKFQKIIPMLLETIQQVEETISKSKIKLLINNSNPNQQWITNGGNDGSKN